jgi:hypothetical protein
MKVKLFLKVVAVVVGLVAGSFAFGADQIQFPSEKEKAAAFLERDPDLIQMYLLQVLLSSTQAAENVSYLRELVVNRYGAEGVAFSSKYVEMTAFTLQSRFLTQATSACIMLAELAKIQENFGDARKHLERAEDLLSLSKSSILNAIAVMAGMTPEERENIKKSEERSVVIKELSLLQEKEVTE